MTTKLTAYTSTNIKNDASFNKAVDAVFSAIDGRFKQVQQLLDLAVNASKDKHDFSWLTQLYIRAEASSGINLDKLALWLSKAITQDPEGEIPALQWNEKNRSFRKAEKGCDIYYHNLKEAWFEIGRKPKLADSFSLVNALESLINKAMKQAKAGALSEKDMAALNRLAGIKAELEPAVDKPDGALTAAEAEQAGVI